MKKLIGMVIAALIGAASPALASPHHYRIALLHNPHRAHQYHTPYRHRMHYHVPYRYGVHHRRHTHTARVFYYTRPHEPVRHPFRQPLPPPSWFPDLFASAGSLSSLGGGGNLLKVAERYNGQGNFTGFNGKWCAAAIGLWLREAGYTRLGSLAARDYAHYGRATAPRPGVIAVMPHHIGIVKEVLPGGSIVLLSGNHRHRVGVGLYSANRIIAFREPV